MKKAYLGKQGQVLYEDNGKYFSVYPFDFKFVVDEDIKVVPCDVDVEEADEIDNSIDEFVKEIDKEEFDRQNTGKAIMFVSTQKEYDEVVNEISNIISDYVSEEIGKVEYPWLYEEKLKIKEKLNREEILSKACREFISNLPVSYVYVRVEEDNGYLFEAFADKEFAVDMLKEETIKKMLEDYISEVIDEHISLRREIYEQPGF